MVGEVITGIGIFKSMLDMTKGLKDMNDATVRNSAAIEFQEKILAAQAEQAALIERVGDLEKEMARFETWESEKERYKLHDFGAGTFAYIPKEGMENDEPPHRICAACYEKGQRSILQFQNKTNFQQDHYVCPTCGTDFKFGERGQPPVIKTRGPRGSWTDR